MSRLCKFIPVFSLLYILIPQICPQVSGILAYFRVRTSFAFASDAHSGQNISPRGATTIRQTKDSRWVIYDRGDQTDWLKVSPPNTEHTQLIIRFNFLRVKGKTLIEVYAEDPDTDFLEKREIKQAEKYEYLTQTIKDHYVKVYAADRGHLAHYEFSYALVTPVSSPTPTVTPTITLSPTPAPAEVSTITPTATHILPESDIRIIADRYGVPFNLLRALGIISSQDGRILGSYEVRNVASSRQLKFLKKIAQCTDRPISDFTGSSSGAMGYMQFLPATFYYYAQDGDGDGIKDPLNPYDSVATAAYFLAREIAKKESIQAALKSYSNSPSVSEKILKLYRELESEKTHTSR